MKVILLFFSMMCTFCTLTSQNILHIKFNKSDVEVTWRRNNIVVDTSKENLFAFMSTLDYITIVRHDNTYKAEEIKISTNSDQILFEYDFKQQDTITLSMKQIDEKNIFKNNNKTNQIIIEILKKINSEPDWEEIYNYKKERRNISPIETVENKQNAYYDALKIAKYIAKKDTIALRLLSNYAGYNDVLTIEELKYVYGEEFDNHFISNLDIFKGKKSIPVIKGQSEVSSSSTELDKKTSPNILSVLSGVDVTKYADGLAKFIVKRFKQDMNEIFFQKMKKEMADNEELQVLFPKTYEELKLIDQNIYDINLFLTSLRERMEEDLRQIFSHANDLMETDKYRLKFKDNPVLGAFLGTVFQVIHGVTQGEHAGMIIENLTFSDAYDKKDDGKNIKAAMQTLRLFSIGLRADTTKETYWIHGKDNVQKLFEGDALAAKIWLGLMYQLAENDKDKPITFADTTLAAKINLWADNTDYFYDTRQYLTTFYNKALAIQDNYVQLKKGKEEKPVVDNWQNYINCYESIIELVEHAPKIIELFDKNEAMSQNWYQGIKIAKGLLTLKVEVEARKYPAAVQHIAALFKALDMRAKFINEDTIKRLGSCIIYENANKQKPLRRFVDIDELKSKFADKDSIKSITILKSEAKEKEIKECKKDNATKILIEPNYDWVNEFVRYASFAASMALTKNSDEVEALLTTTTLPSGSVSRKSKGVSLMVNTYLSTIYGFYLKKENERTDLSQGFAISAPIGLSLNMGIYKKREKEYWENSLPRNFQAFVSVFDVGTLVNTRLVNDTIQVPKITLGNIFAPGLYFKLGGWFNLPITLGVGVQKLPNLILKGDKQIIIPTATRYSISLSWDIPMWNIKHWRN